MLFNSYSFIFIFLPVTFFGYFLLKKNDKTNSCKLFLIAASLFFYSWWNVNYLPLIVGSMAFNYWIGMVIQGGARQKSVRKKQILTLGICGNLFLLGYFKYFYFLAENLNEIFSTDFDLVRLALPLAISFFTFQQITYLVDSFKGKVKEASFLDYALYVTFFPQLIAGPIVHHRKMMPQFSDLKNHKVDSENIAKGIFIFSIGLFKKVVIADTFAAWSDLGFSSPSMLNLTEAWVASFSFGFQLYFDFSGYADMAIGLGLLFNIKLPVNFRSPYKALDIQSFWTRWHITLSHFLRDYISLPLKRRNVGLYTNIMMTFLVSGLWHGAGWTFVVWGLLHGSALVVHAVWKKCGRTLPMVAAWLLTFVFLTITRTFFRADNIADASRMVHTMIFGVLTLPSSGRVERYFGFLAGDHIVFGDWLKNLDGNKWTLGALCGAFVIILCFKNSMDQMEKMTPNKKTLFATVFMLVTALGYLSKEKQFYYFVF